MLSAAAKLDKLRKMDALHARHDEPDTSRVLRGRVWGAEPERAPGRVLGRAAPEQPEVERRRRELRDAQPMSHAEFMRRFDELRARDEPAPAPAPAPAPPAPRDDRFSQIKSSLRELRRGLNEVTDSWDCFIPFLTRVWASRFLFCLIQRRSPHVEQRSVHFITYEISGSIKL